VSATVFAQRLLLARRTARVIVAVSLALSGCRTDADSACLPAFESAQTVVMNVKGEKLDSLDSSIAAVDGAIATRESAGRSGEVEELSMAR